MIRRNKPLRRSSLPLTRTPMKPTDHQPPTAKREGEP